MKQCLYSNCKEEIMNWQKYCFRHKNTEEIKMENQQQQNNYGNPTVRPTEPVVQQQMPPPPPEFIGGGNVLKQPVQPLPEPKTEKLIQKTFEKRTLGDRDSLIVKQVAFKEAVKLTFQMEEVIDMEYNKLLGKIRRLTVDFYNIIIEKNEQG